MTLTGDNDVRTAKWVLRGHGQATLKQAQSMGQYDKIKAQQRAAIGLN